MTSTPRIRIFVVVAGVAILAAILWLGYRSSKPLQPAGTPAEDKAVRQPAMAPDSSPDRIAAHDASAVVLVAPQPSVVASAGSVKSPSASPASATPIETTPDKPSPKLAATPQPNPDEAAATARMIAAHAPLRSPEVADPDSKTNREILQTMVTKALARQVRPTSAFKN